VSGVRGLMRPERIPDPVRSAVLRVLAARDFDAGRVGVPSERAKRRHLLTLFRAGGHRSFVESGTYLGGTVAFFVPHAERIISVEVDERLYARAQERFRGVAHVEILRGDAFEVLPRIVGALAEPPLVWLDGHCSDGSTGQGSEFEPAIEILPRLAASTPPGTTVVVDDVRLFGSEPRMPTLEALVDGARAAFPSASVRVELDSLVIR